MIFSLCLGPPFKSKNARTVTDAFVNVLEESGGTLHYFQTDEGKEYENRVFHHMLNVRNIKFFTVKSPSKAAPGRNIQQNHERPHVPIFYGHRLSSMDRGFATINRVF